MNFIINIFQTSVSILIPKCWLLMDPSSSSLFDNTAATMIDDWIEKNFLVAPLPASPPTLASTTPLDTPPDCQSPFFQSPPALIPQDDDVSSVEIIEQK